MDYFKEKVKIKHLSFPRFMSGPVDDVTDSPLRQLVREFSKEELLYTEIRNVRSILTPLGGERSLSFKQFERPLNFQVSVNSTEFIEPVVEKILKSGVDLIDINAGCPAKNVISSGCGSALMANPEMLEKILKEFKRVLSDDISLTLKIRSGFKEINGLDIAKLAEDCGVDALAIHPRLQTEKFSGIPDYNLVAKIKKSIKIPILYSGNVVNLQTAKMAYEKTGADGFLIGRGMWAKPWKLYEIKCQVEGKPFKIDNNLILKVALKHLSLMVKQFGFNGFCRFKKHLPFYIKGSPNASVIRTRLLRSDSEDVVREGLREFLR